MLFLNESKNAHYVEFKDFVPMESGKLKQILMYTA